MLAIGQSYEADILEVILKIVDLINSNSKLPRDPINLEKPLKTIFERGFDLLRSKGNVGVSYSELKQLIIDYGEVSPTYIDLATRKLISRIKAKLEEEGYTLVSYKPREDRQLYYFIIKQPS